MSRITASIADRLSKGYGEPMTYDEPEPQGEAPAGDGWQRIGGDRFGGWEAGGGETWWPSREAAASAVQAHRASAEKHESAYERYGEWQARTDTGEEDGESYDERMAQHAALASAHRAYAVDAEDFAAGAEPMRQAEPRGSDSLTAVLRGDAHPKDHMVATAERADPGEHVKINGERYRVESMTRNQGGGLKLYIGWPDSGEPTGQGAVVGAATFVSGREPFLTLNHGPAGSRQAQIDTFEHLMDATEDVAPWDLERSMTDSTLSDLLQKSSDLSKPPGSGWQAIPSGKHGGFRRKKGTGWEYWYPSREHAHLAAQSQGLWAASATRTENASREALSGDLSDEDRAHHERMAKEWGARRIEHEDHSRAASDYKPSSESVISEMPAGGPSATDPHNHWRGSSVELHAYRYMRNVFLHHEREASDFVTLAAETGLTLGTGRSTEEKLGAWALDAQRYVSLMAAAKEAGLEHDMDKRETFQWAVSGKTELPFGITAEIPVVQFTAPVKGGKRHGQPKADDPSQNSHVRYAVKLQRNVATANSHLRDLLQEARDLSFSGRISNVRLQKILQTADEEHQRAKSAVRHLTTVYNTAKRPNRNAKVKATVSEHLATARQGLADASALRDHVKNRVEGLRNAAADRQRPGDSEQAARLSSQIKSNVAQVRTLRTKVEQMIAGGTYSPAKRTKAAKDARGLHGVILIDMNALRRTTDRLSDEEANKYGGEHEGVLADIKWIRERKAQRKPKTKPKPKANDTQGDLFRALSRGQTMITFSDLAKGKGAKPSGSGWQAIPGGKHGGFRRKRGTGWEYWYPSADAHKSAEAHHRAEHGKALKRFADGSDADADENIKAVDHHREVTQHISTANRAANHTVVYGKQESQKRSKYDALPASHSPFGWATPARDYKGHTPQPWRVPHKERATAWLASKFKHADLYVDYQSGRHEGREQIWVGLRDNRDKASHRAKLKAMHDKLKGEGFPVRMAPDGGHFFIVDDLKRDQPTAKALPAAATISKAGPYIGPRGGKWADPAHKVPWQEGQRHRSGPTGKTRHRNYDAGHAIGQADAKRGANTRAVVQSSDNPDWAAGYHHGAYEAHRETQRTHMAERDADAKRSGSHRGYGRKAIDSSEAAHHHRIQYHGRTGHDLEDSSEGSNSTAKALPAAGPLYAAAADLLTQPPTAEEGDLFRALSRGQTMITFSDLAKAKGAKPSGSGWQAIPGGKHGGFRRKSGTGWEYWYPSAQAARSAAAHHHEMRVNTEGLGLDAPHAEAARGAHEFADSHQIANLPRGERIGLGRSASGKAVYVKRTQRGGWLISAEGSSVSRWSDTKEQLRADLAHFKAHRTIPQTQKALPAAGPLYAAAADLLTQPPTTE